ncbi:MAG TPA: DUF4124 domain-containing protein [Thiobacillus sp.]|nr:DUF4124 domain-containing protein [Thiobacillus sp.]
MSNKLTGYRHQAFRPHAGRLLFWLVLAFSVHAHAELYKWTDGQGKVQYTDHPPTLNSQTLKYGNAGQAETTSKATQSLDAKDQAFQKRNKEARDAHDKAEKEAEQARIASENCDKARKNLSTLQNANTPRIYTTNSAGQRIYMDDSARASALANSQKNVSDFCK